MSSSAVTVTVLDALPVKELTDLPNLTLLEISYLLGFADPSNFFRAFRRWFDATPGEYPARL